MTFTPKLIALDVDGTLVDGTNAMSPAVREAVHAVREAGIATVIATGRSIPGVMNAVENIGLTEGYAVASNGAVTLGYDPAVTLLNTVTFDAREAVRRVMEAVPEALVAVEETGVGFRLNRPFPEGELGDTYVLEDLESLIAKPVTRVIIRAPEHEAQAFHELVEGLGLTDTNYYIGYTAWLDLAPVGVSKASGLTYLCERLGCDAADVLAVGDGNNDIEMLRWAGRGVAMGQAPEGVKAAADAVTGSVLEDGLVAELERYL